MCIKIVIYLDLGRDLYGSIQMLKGNTDYHITTYVTGNMQDLYKYRASLGHGQWQSSELCFARHCPVL